MPAPQDFTGIKFGRLTAIRSGPLLNGDRHWIWRCDCGTEKSASVKNVKYGKIVSCGCNKREKATRHGFSNSRTYRIWGGMKGRCGSDHHPNYSEVKVCERWHSFENFLADMGECPDGLTIERIENSKGYEPENCKWATRLDQALNRDCVIWAKVEDKTVSLREACRMLNLPYSTIHHRVKNLGMGAEEALGAQKWLR